MKYYLLFLLMVMTVPIFAQSQTVTGKITDEAGEPLPGVTVQVKASTVGTVSDLNGNYELNDVPGGSILVYSYVGMLSQEIEVGNQSEISVVLVEDAVGLEEVIVVGYGTQKKGNLTGAVSAVKADDISKVPVANVSQALSGRVPGLVTRQLSGEPGYDKVDISIRGFGPALVIVDGVERPMTDLDPNEIESVTVLKDASAAVYGARAGNGVILVTTKRGTIMKPTFTLNSTYSMQGLTLYPESMDAAQYSELVREAEINVGVPEENMRFSEAEVQKYQEGTEPGYEGSDWWDAIVRDYAPMQQHNLSVRGGSKQASYYTFLGYTQQGGMWKSGDNRLDRFNLRSNLDTKITDNITMSADISLITGKINRPRRDITTLFHDVRFHTPTYPTSLPDPDKVAYCGQVANGIAGTTSDIAGYNKGADNNFNGTLSAKWDVPFVQGLAFKGLVNYQFFMEENKGWTKKYDQWTYDHTSDTYTNWGSHQTESSLSESFSRARKLTGQLSASYNRVFDDKHDLSALLLAEGIDEYSKWFSAGRGGYITSSLEYLFAGSPDVQTANGAASETGRLSYIGRLNYAYEGKYLFESTFRYDGSPKFPEDRRWGFFPSASIGWRLSQESFMNNLDWLDNLKLRASASKTGYDGIGAFQYLAGYGFASRYMIGGETRTGLEPTGLANPFITWEDMTIYNIGVDFAAYRGMLYSEIDVFYRDRENMLATRQESLPLTFGADLPQENINSQNNRGFDILVGHRNISGEFRYDVSGNISWTRAKWDHFEEPEYTDPDDIRINQKSGNWTNRVFGYIDDGLFTSQDEIDNHTLDQDLQGNATLQPGDVKYIDQNEDGVLDWRDKVEIGYGQTPNLMFGLNINMSYKGFDLSALIQGAGRRDFFPTVDLTDFRGNLEILYTKRWHEGNNDANAEVPRVYPGGKENNKPKSTYWMKDGSYVRLKVLNIGYNLPKEWISRVHLANVRIYFGGTNLLTFSELTGWQLDPEVNIVSRSYPVQKVYTFGLSLDF